METKHAGIHTAGDDSNRRASASRREAFVAGWKACAEASDDPWTVSDEPTEKEIAQWEAATRDESVDGVHPREAREEA